MSYGTSFHESPVNPCYTPNTATEDRATVGTDPSADPGAKTEGRATLGTLGSPVFLYPSGLAWKR